jgi:hypothetical protein
LKVLKRNLYLFIYLFLLYLFFYLFFVLSFARRSEELKGHCLERRRRKGGSLLDNARVTCDDIDNREIVGDLRKAMVEWRGKERIDLVQCKRKVEEEVRRINGELEKYESKS